jgi:hypothetical protein
MQVFLEMFVHRVNHAVAKSPNQEERRDKEKCERQFSAVRHFEEAFFICVHGCVLWEQLLVQTPAMRREIRRRPGGPEAWRLVADGASNYLKDRAASSYSTRTFVLAPRQNGPAFRDSAKRFIQELWLIGGSDT